MFWFVVALAANPATARTKTRGLMQQPFARQPVNLAVLGLGYVGLPLAVALGRRHPTVGFDIDPQRVAELSRGHDRTLEVTAEALRSNQIRFSADPAELADCNVFIVTVPTPIDRHKRPDLGALRAATRTVAQAIRPGGIVVYESTVYPGATEDECLPIIEQATGLKRNEGFFAGYSPERANPGDPEHRLDTIVKVVAGSTPAVADFLAELYGEVVPAGVHRAGSIRVAEAAKVIENTQRDLNIALINEFALIFNRMGLDTAEVLAAAATKWNFLRFQPGLVGGHCIGVDPYYLTFKAQDLGYHPEVILAGRRINDGMGAYVARELVKAMIRKGTQVKDARVLLLGLAFKENTPDLRNSGVASIVAELREHAVQVDVHDPWVDAAEAEHEYGVSLTPEPQPGAYDAVVLAVAHRQFRELGPDALRAFGKPGAVLFDVKSVLPKEASDLRL
jgi:UDP-N-acetyl-D-glucosamine/UDP-N-acetyl-D-galactosamine dehydrogenase